MARKLPVNDHDKEFANHIIQQIDTTKTKIETVEDILFFIREYKNFTLSKIERKPEHTFWPTYQPLIGLKMHPGIMHIYGPPDHLKTYIGINVANWFADNTQLSVCYIDAENKLWKSDKKALRDGIYLVAGRSDSHNLVRKLVSENAFQVLIIDTIVALSRYEDFLRNIIKSIDVNGIYILCLNQTYSHNYEEIPAGNDVIPELAYENHKIISLEKDKHNYYIATNTNIYMGFVGDDRAYSGEESLWFQALKEGHITIKEGQYFYKNLGYSSKEVIMKLLSDEYRDNNVKTT